MFSSLAYAIILMGCSDDMSLCRDTARHHRPFATLQECRKAEAKALTSETALQIDYPVVAAKCIMADDEFPRESAAYIAG